MTKIQIYAGGRRERVEKEEATKMVERWTKEMEGSEGVFRVDLSCRAWSLEAVIVIRPFLEKFAKDVKILNLNDIIASLETEEGLAVTVAMAEMFSKSPVIDVDLSHNAMGPRGLVRVQSLLSRAPLQRLYLDNCGLSYESLILFREWTTGDDCRIAKGLKELVLDRNMIGAEGAQEISEFLPRCENLQRFSCLGCRLRDGGDYLARGLKKMTQNCDNLVLNRLEMDDCTFNAKGCVQLAEALSACRLLRYLNLSDAGFEVVGLRLVIDALAKARATLTHLYLDGVGELGVEGATILAEYLENQASNMLVFACSNNELGDDGVVTLLQAFGATQCSLEVLHLECNEMEAGSAKALVQLMLPRLKKLNVADNDDLPKKNLKAKYGEIVSFGEDDGDEEEEGEDDESNLSDLIKQMQAALILKS